MEDAIKVPEQEHLDKLAAHVAAVGFVTVPAGLWSRAIDTIKVLRDGGTMPIESMTELWDMLAKEAELQKSILTPPPKPFDPSLIPPPPVEQVATMGAEVGGVVTTNIAGTTLGAPDASPIIINGAAANDASPSSSDPPAGAAA